MRCQLQLMVIPWCEELAATDLRDEARCAWQCGRAYGGQFLRHHVGSAKIEQQQTRGRLAILQSIGQRSQRQRLDTCNGFLLGGAIGKHPWQISVRTDTCSRSRASVATSARAATPNALPFGRSGWTPRCSHRCRIVRWCSPSPSGCSPIVSTGVACSARSRASPPAPSRPPFAR